MTGLEGLSTLAVCRRLTLFLGRALYALLTKANQFDLASLLGQHGMGLAGPRRSLGFVVSGECFASVFDAHCVASQRAAPSI